MSKAAILPGFCEGARVRCELCAAREAAICGVLAPEELARLARIACSTQLAPGETLFEEGEPADQVFTLVEGVLQLCKLLEDGRRQITGFLVPGDFVGLAFGSDYVYSAEAVTRARLCAFRRAPFLVLLGEYPHLEQNLFARVTSELVAAHEQMLLLGRKTAKERVASFLLRFSARLGGVERFDLPMGRSAIGDYLGLTIETVSRTLTALRRDGVIALEGRTGVRLIDRKRLADAAGH
jgi:CRP/FNR family transcriptional regulator